MNSSAISYEKSDIFPARYARWSAAITPSRGSKRSGQADLVAASATAAEDDRRGN